MTGPLTTPSSPLVEERRRIFAWANGDAVLLSARCAKAEQHLSSIKRAVREFLTNGNHETGPLERALEAVNEADRGY